jgi:lysophospholipase L1-like esterase
MRDVDHTPHSRYIDPVKFPALLVFSAAIVGATPAAQTTPSAGTPGAGPADRAAPRTDENSMKAHAQLLEKAKQGRIDIYFLGDSIVRRWGALDYPELLANWRENFFGWNAANFGWGADLTQNILWRLENGELDGVAPKVIVLLAGTNNVGKEPRDEPTMAEIASGVKAIIDVCRRKAPDATIVVTAILPRHDNVAVMPAIDGINRQIATFADGRRVRFLDINDRLLNKDGTLVDGVLNERDKLHPTLKGYQLWADALKPIFRELLGPPAATDQAPPPTGDPSAVRRPRVDPDYVHAQSSGWKKFLTTTRATFRPILVPSFCE